MGFQVGARFRDLIVAECEDARRSPPPMTMTECTEHLLVAQRLATSEIPQVIAELQGIADGAQVRFFDLLLSLYEDLWDKNDSETGCTDLVATRAGTLMGSLLMGHNNDNDASAPPPFLLRLMPDDGPVVTGVALGGVGLSLGCNEHGLIIMGNQVIANDVKPGIPRILLVRAALDQPTMHGALALLLHPSRSSSYNNIVGDSSGRVVSIEGSGTKSRLIVPTGKGILTHTNHYQHPDMQEVEGKVDQHSTSLREERACRLMSGQAGTHTVDSFQRVLQDHEGYPDSICRHNNADAVTGFSVIWEVQERVLWYTTGRPCQGVYQPVQY